MMKERIPLTALVILVISALLTGCGSEEFKRADTTSADSGLNCFDVFLDVDMSQSEAIAIGKEFREIDHVDDILLIDKDEAIEKYREIMGDLYENASGDDNPLPYAYRITVDKEAASDQELFDLVVEQIRRVELTDSSGAVIGKVDSISSHRYAAE